MRIQAILIGFCFNALIESFAGFGAPIAITAAMMIALGIKPMRAVTVSLVSNVSVAAFGPMSIPITIAGSMTSLDPARIGGLVALQIGVLAIGFPLLQCAILDGWRGVKELWWYALAIGIAWSLAANLTVRFVSYELTCLLASLVSLAVAVLLLRPWRTPAVLSRVDATLALLPYIFVVAVFAVANIVVNKPLNALTVTFNWPLVATRILHSQPVFSLNWATTPGTLLFVAGLLTVAVYRRWPKHTDSTTASLTWQSAFAQLGSGAARLWVTALTICTVMGLAYVMNYSGQTGAIGTVLSLTGPFAIILSPVLGFIGTAVTGSTGSSNALFASMQVAAATAVEADPLLFVAASTSGAVVGKIISPELLAVTAAVINHRGAEQEILKTVTPYAVGILVVVCLYVFAQQVLFY
ncbi:MAG: L-lactate permease [Corynebacterium sp.]|nr:L-lactate permease [Corynebacterium sp.]